MPRHRWPAGSIDDYLDLEDEAPAWLSEHDARAIAEEISFDIQAQVYSANKPDEYDFKERRAEGIRLRCAERHARWARHDIHSYRRYIRDLIERD